MEQEASPPPSIHASQRRSDVGDQTSEIRSQRGIPEILSTHYSALSTNTSGVRRKDAGSL